MTRRKLRGLLAGVTLLATPSFLFGKAETIRVTISGGGLTNPIQITDAKVLQVSHAWSSEFLDLSRPPVTQVPDPGSAYEVSIYSGTADNDIRKTCIFFYSPSSSAAGLIYLPGKGALHTVNSGTIIRQGRDGKWSYASPAWEARIKPLIDEVPARRALPQETVISQWTKPQAGWLYVLDPRSDPTSPGSRVWLVNPEKSAIMGSIRAGYDPDFALSPDGSKLYIVSGERESGEVAVVDTATGNIRHIAFPERILYKPWYQGLPPFSEMAITSDGRALWISEQYVRSPDNVEIRLSVFDTQSERFLERRVDPGSCDHGEFVASPAANHLDFMCGSSAKSNAVRLVRLDGGQDQISASIPFNLPLPTQCYLAEAFPLSGGNKIALVRSDGAVYQMDTTTLQFSPTPRTGDCREWKLAPAEWPRSEAGTKVYLGYGGVALNGMSAAKEFRVVDTQKWVESGHVQTSSPFWSAAVSQNDKYIYAVSPEGHGIVVVDANTLQEIRVIRVGNTPSLAIVAPSFAPRD